MAKFAIVGTIKTAPGKRDEYLKHLTAHAQRCLATEPGTLKSPCAPYIVCVDSDAIRDGVEVIDLPERVSDRSQCAPFRCYWS